MPNTNGNEGAKDPGRAGTIPIPWEPGSQLVKTNFGRSGEGTGGRFPH